MNLDEIVTYYSLKRVFLCRSFPMQIACSHCLWWDTSHVLLQSVLATITLVEGRAEDGEARAGARW